jgi:hypothetical protein
MPGMDHLLAKGFLATGGSVAYTFGQVVEQVNASTGPLSVINQAQCVQYPLAASLSALRAGAPVLGVCQENLDAVKTATGKAIIGIALQGDVKVVWDGTGTPSLNNAVIPSYTGGGGSLIAVGNVAFVAPTAGTFNGYPVVGIPLTLPAAAGDWFDIQLTPGDRI